MHLAPLSTPSMNAPITSWSVCPAWWGPRAIANVAAREDMVCTSSESGFKIVHPSRSRATKSRRWCNVILLSAKAKVLAMLPSARAVVVLSDVFASRRAAAIAIVLARALKRSKLSSARPSALLLSLATSSATSNVCRMACLGMSLQMKYSPLPGVAFSKLDHGRRVRCFYPCSAPSELGLGLSARGIRRLRDGLCAFPGSKARLVILKRFLAGPCLLRMRALGVVTVESQLCSSHSLVCTYTRCGDIDGCVSKPAKM